MLRLWRMAILKQRAFHDTQDIDRILHHICFQTQNETLPLAREYLGLATTDCGYLLQDRPQFVLNQEFRRSSYILPRKRDVIAHMADTTKRCYVSRLFP